MVPHCKYNKKTRTPSLSCPGVYGAFIVNFGQISDIVYGVLILEFEQVSAGWKVSWECIACLLNIDFALIIL